MVFAWGAAAGGAVSVALAAASPARLPRSARRDCAVLMTLTCAAVSTAMAADTGYPSLIPITGAPVALAGFALSSLIISWLRGLFNVADNNEGYLKTNMSVGVVSLALLASLPLLIFYQPGAALGGSLAGAIAAWGARRIFDRISNLWVAFFVSGVGGLLISAVLMIPMVFFASTLVVTVHDIIYG